jgi:hypothetical protein
MKGVLTPLLSVLISLSALCVTFFPVSASAAVRIPFGGRAMLVIPCTCDDAWIVAVGLPTPGAFVYRMGVTTLYSFYEPLEPAWQLGLAIPPGVCMMVAYPSCYDIEMEYTMYMDGTSLF